MSRPAVKALARDVWCEGIHGVTGQVTEEGTLAAGALVREMESEETEDGLSTEFEASTDGGRTWFRQRTLGRVDTDDDVAYGLTFSEWLAAARRTDSASEYDLRAAWRAGEDPSIYVRPMEVR